MTIMMTVLFFLGVPLFCGLLQFFLTRSHKVKRWKKSIPLGVVSLVAALTWGASFGHVPLPKTYILDQGGFFRLPDFTYVGLFCFPALLGIMLGTIFGIANPGRGDTP